jgi:hypothetical protein
MKRSGIMISIVGLVVASLMYAHSQTPRTNTEARSQTQAAKEQAAIENSITTQRRINHYFHGDVMPKLKNCWSVVQGNGMITLKYTYNRVSSNRWGLATVAVNNSTLAKAQQVVALKCMQDSVRGTSFPVDTSDRNEKAFVLNWSWPVPFPDNADELTRTMFLAKGNGNTGGCDGHGAAAACFTCNDTNGCDKVCVGSSYCATVTSRTGTECHEGGACASGGPFGVGSRGISIY